MTGAMSSSSRTEILVNAPLACFEQALVALAAREGGQ